MFLRNEYLLGFFMFVRGKGLIVIVKVDKQQLYLVVLVLCIRQQILAIVFQACDMSYEQNPKIDTIDSVIQLNLLLTEKWLFESHLLPYSHSYSKSRDALASKKPTFVLQPRDCLLYLLAF